MQNFEKEIVTEKKDILKEVICDRCGKQLLKTLPDDASTSDKNKNSAEALLPARFKADFGYTSNLDGDEWLAELCSECAIDVFDFINSGSGNGVQVENIWNNFGVDYEQDCFQAPFDLNKYELNIKDWKCQYHPEKGNLILEERGLVCKQDGCPTIFKFLNKTSLKEKTNPTS